MAANKHIESGILELYIAGALSEKENEQVYRLIMEYPEILEEVKEIEKSIATLTSHVAPKNVKGSFKDILIQMLQEKEDSAKVVALKTSKRNWVTYTGWAAALVVGSTLILSLNKNANLQGQIESINEAKEQFEIQLDKTNSNLAENKKLLAVIRSKDIVTVPLQGQKVYPEAYAKVYWNKDSKNIYLDVQGLPDPPEGKVYQVWSLKLDPLSPTSLGTLDDFATNENKVFTINNPNDSQAFGITLEPAGGSKTPTLDQLYTLGAV
ncbi:anti-sigma factor [Tenacibaculum caenipelagi]|uniref:Anti-sigma-K factor rskA n=1 Tax=Tenacibaculum caenipelagi TaxID=1325435 RepID=A0A4R6TLG2_9FLAO|nr:anti-sigma factor [Tenacibaculum caenipelagi]TDQ29870.1 anti-sigma-K factor rskA [Tenacibaculum caenipelagi]